MLTCRMGGFAHGRASGEGCGVQNGWFCTREGEWRGRGKEGADREGLEIAVKAAPKVLEEAGERRPEDFSWVVAEVGEEAAVAATEARERALAGSRPVPRVQDAEIAHVVKVVDELGTSFHVGLAEEELVLEAEVVLEGEHRGGGEAAHAQTLQRLEGLAALSRRQLPQHIVVVHHLPEAESAGEVMAIHVRHAEDGVEEGRGVADGGFGNGGMTLAPALEAGVAERVVHLRGMEMKLHDGVVKDVHLALLVENVVDVEFVRESFQDCLARPLDPDIDVATLAATRSRIKPRQTCSLQYAAIDPFALEERFQFSDMLFVSGVDVCDPAGEPVPFGENLNRRLLLIGKPVYTVI